MEETREYGEFFGTGVWYGLVDPTIPPGIDAPIATLYRRNNNGVGEIWVKIGIADTDWGELQVKVMPN